MSEPLSLASNVLAIPSLQGRLVFAEAVRKEIQKGKTSAIIVDLLPEIGKKLLSALKALPDYNVLVIEKEGHYGFIPVELSDAKVAALYYALHYEIPIFFSGEAHFVEPGNIYFDDYQVYAESLESFFKNQFLPILKSKFNNFFSFYPTKSIFKNTASFIKYYSTQYKQILYVGSMFTFRDLKKEMTAAQPELPQIVPSPPVGIYKVYSSSVKYICREIPWILENYMTNPKGEHLFDKKKAYHQFLETVIEQSPFKPSKTRVASFISYLEKFLYTKKRSIPELSEIAEAARLTIGEDFAVSLYKIGGRYLPAQKKGQFPVIEFKTDFLETPHGSMSLDLILNLNLKNHVSALKRAINMREKMPPVDDGEEINPIYDLFIPGGSRLTFEETLFRILDTFAEKHIQYPFANINLILIFNEYNKEKYPWSDAVLPLDDEEGGLFFYATNPLWEQAFHSEELIFGGFLFQKPYIERTPLPTHTPYETILQGALDFEEEGVCFYIAPSPPNKIVQERFKKSTQNLVYIPLGKCPEFLLAHLIRVKNLESHRISKLLNQDPT